MYNKKVVLLLGKLHRTLQVWVIQIEYTLQNYYFTYD